jgi:glycosyltransferase involved in cell wall biosynthesis
MRGTAKPSVLIAQRHLPEYRRPFFADLECELARRGIDFQLVTRTTQISIGSRKLVWQPCREQALAADLVIVEQASRLLLNYWLLLQQRRGRTRVAFWGHGANLAHSEASRLGEAVKRRVSRWPHWWFAYTEGSKHRMAELGYPDERITVVQNAISTEGLRQLSKDAKTAELAAYRSALGVLPDSTALFLGRLVPKKRLDFLLTAVDRIREAEPRFVLLVAGDGPGRAALEEAAARRPHLRVLGRLDAHDKVLALRSTSVMLLPASVGLAILDGFALGLPLITLAAQDHGPELEYLTPGVNGVLLPAGSGPDEYASSVLELLGDADRLNRLARGAAETASRITMGEMVRRFSAGIEQALAAEPPR